MFCAKRKNDDYSPLSTFAFIFPDTRVVVYSGSPVAHEMIVCETDPAWWAILLSYSMILGFTLGVGLSSQPWDTISTMVAREELTLHGFAMVVVAMVLCQVYWVRTQLQRWGKLHKHNKLKAVGPPEATDPRIPTQGHWSAHPLAATCIAIGSVCSVVGSLGFGIVSTNLKPDQHLHFAGVAFGGVLLYLVGFAYLGANQEHQHAKGLGAGLLLASAVCLWQLANDKQFWWEYILVSALHGGALALTVPLEHRIFYTWV